MLGVMTSLIEATANNTSPAVSAINSYYNHFKISLKVTKTNTILSPTVTISLDVTANRISHMSLTVTVTANKLAVYYKHAKPASGIYVCICLYYRFHLL